MEVGKNIADNSLRKVVIRLADKDDVNELARLRWVFSLEDEIRENRPFEQYLAEFRDFFTKGLDDGKWIVFVAETPDKLISNVWLEIVETVPRPTRSSHKWGYLTNVYTQPDFRGAGIGTRLLQAAVSAGHVMKLELVIVWPSDESVEFYKREGFAPNPMLMERKLDINPRGSRQVVVSDYDPRWPQMFEEEKERIQAVIGEHVVAIEHVGSTAVPGLGAKPIIDIQVGVQHLSDSKKCIRPLQSIGYEHAPWADADIPNERRYFRRSTEGVRSHHLHMCEMDSDWWVKHLAFRDHLRNNPDDARRYFELKKELAPKFEWDTIGYTDAKTDFVKSALDEIKRARF